MIRPRAADVIRPRAALARGSRWGALALGLLGCVATSLPEGPAYRPSRHDYERFRAAHPQVIEPNVLPFMAHRVRTPDGGEALVFCRWPAERFPLAVAIESSPIPEALQHEFDPIPLRAFVAAVDAALRAWERELEGLVRFRRVRASEPADLRLRLVPGLGPAPESTVSVLGTAPLARACRVRGHGPRPGLLEVAFEVPEVVLYLADHYGLLPPDLVHRVALHEVGHALGMRGHSPVPADLMYPVARDSLSARRPSESDINSFVSLYALPNGTVYRRLEGGVAEPAAAAPPNRPPPGEPRLAPAPHVDARFGYELRVPEGWVRLETTRGMIAADGVIWDYGATFQVIVRGYPSLAEYLARHEAAHVGAGVVLARRRTQVAGRPALRLLVRDRQPGWIEEIHFLETGDGRVVVVIADSEAEAWPAYRPWFRATLASLEVRTYQDSGSPGR